MTAEDTHEDDSEGQYIGDIESAELVTDDRLSLTPEQHEQLKNQLHGNQFKSLRRANRRYLVIGRGSGPAGDRRLAVCRLLDERPKATAFRLEDFGFTGDDIDLWAPAFDILSKMATYVVGVLEDFDGGHVWELGYLYHYQTHVRDTLWLLKRIYSTTEEMRDHYDNGMAASHLAALEEAIGEHVITWEDPGDLPDAVKQLP